MPCFGSRYYKKDGVKSLMKPSQNAAAATQRFQTDVRNQANDEEGSRRKYLALPLCGPPQQISAVDLTAWIRGAMGCTWEERYAVMCFQLHREYGCDNTAALRLLQLNDLVSVGFKPLHARTICSQLANRLPGATPIGATPIVAGSPAAGPSVATPIVAGTSVAGTAVASTAVAGTAVAGTAVAGTAVADIADPPVGGTPVGGTPVAANESPASPKERSPLKKKDSVTAVCVLGYASLVGSAVWACCDYDSFHKSMAMAGYLSLAAAAAGCLSATKVYVWTLVCLCMWGWLHFGSFHCSVTVAGYSVTLLTLAYMVSGMKLYLHWLHFLSIRSQGYFCRLRPPGEPSSRHSQAGYSVRSIQFTIKMADGILLATTLREPRFKSSPAGTAEVDGSLPHDATRLKLPVILMRTPYSMCLFTFIAHLFAERGYHVIQQDTRGRFDSEGEFTLGPDEMEDGTQTLQWIHEQEWCDGQVGMWGVSYDGYCAWAAMAGTLKQGKPLIHAFMPIFTSSDLTKRGLFHSGVFGLELGMRYVHLTNTLSQPRKWLDSYGVWELWKLLTIWSDKYSKGPHFERAMRHLPVSDVDKELLGSKPIKIPLEAENPLDSYWQLRDHSPCLDLIRGLEDPPAVHIVAGWFDIFVNASIADFTSMGSCPSAMLTIGPWCHLEPQQWSTHEAIDLFDSKLKKQHCATKRLRVRAWMLGSESESESRWQKLKGLLDASHPLSNQSDANICWRNFDRWPPEESTACPLYLNNSYTLTSAVPTDFGSESYVYDPADPTPSVGGPLFHPRFAGSVDNQKLESREDVLSFTSTPLSRDVELAGMVTAHVWVTSSAQTADFMARLCNVSPDGKSHNMCDGIIRLRDWSHADSSAELPAGWEKSVTSDGRTYYTDHNSHTTSWIHPCLSKEGGKSSHQDGNGVQTVNDLLQPLQSLCMPRKVGRRRASFCTDPNRTPSASAAEHSLVDPQLIQIELGSLCAMIRAGHRIRLQVCSGAFPRFDRNLGIQDKFMAGEAMTAATQQVHFGKAASANVWNSNDVRLGDNLTSSMTCSHLSLPVLGGGGLADV